MRGGGIPVARFFFGAPDKSSLTAMRLAGTRLAGTRLAGMRRRFAAPRTDFLFRFAFAMTLAPSVIETGAGTRDQATGAAVVRCSACSRRRKKNRAARARPGDAINAPREMTAGTQQGSATTPAAEF
ncbi:MAG: hypothetical protein K2Z80_04280 [Xanthobacteraceae bacterium]|nr:hypothetical protein [Xanthobacteraceae bacterium]